MDQDTEFRAGVHSAVNRRGLAAMIDQVAAVVQFSVDDGFGRHPNKRVSKAWIAAVRRLEELAERVRFLTVGCPKVK